MFNIKLTGLSTSSIACHDSLCNAEIGIWPFGYLIVDIFAGKRGKLFNVWFTLHIYTFGVIVSCVEGATHCK